MTIAKSLKSTLVILLFCVFSLISAQSAQAAPPISGTFVHADIVYKSESEYRSLLQELKDTGINLLILPSPTILIKNCTTGQYDEQMTSFIMNNNPLFFSSVVKLAKEMGFTMYFDVANHMQVSGYCFYFDKGTLGDESTDKGKLIAYSLRGIDRLKSFLLQNNISWDDPSIAGLYLVPEGDSRYMANANTSTQLKFFKDLSALVKQKEPNKKILTSNFQYEDATYEISKQAYLNLLNETDIDILSPQDSMGTGVTQTYARSSDHYRALHDALESHKQSHPNSQKEVWANIESFQAPSDNFSVIWPTTFTKLKQQIDAAKPYVSHMITWIYQYSMLSNPLSDNVAPNSFAHQYNPAEAALRKNLRNDYLAYYSCKQLYTYSTNSKQCQPTNSSYNSDQFQCDANNSSFANTCNQNLASYPGVTTGICYVSQDECIKAGDLTGDSNTNATDYQKFLTYFQNKNISGDLNHDGTVDIFDYNLLVAYYK